MVTLGAIIVIPGVFQLEQRTAMVGFSQVFYAILICLNINIPSSQLRAYIMSINGLSNVYSCTTFAIIVFHGYPEAKIVRNIDAKHLSTPFY